MRRTAAVLTLIVVMLTSSSLAYTGTGMAAGSNPSPVNRPTPEPSSSPLALGFDGSRSDRFPRFYGDRTLHSSGTVTGDARSVMGDKGDYTVMVCHAAFYRDTVGILSQMLVDSSGGRFASADTYYIGSGGHTAFPATDWYNNGCRAILVFTEYPPADTYALGDSLARFIQLPEGQGSTGYARGGMLLSPEGRRAKLGLRKCHGLCPWVSTWAGAWWRPCSRTALPARSPEPGAHRMLLSRSRHRPAPLARWARSTSRSTR